MGKPANRVEIGVVEFLRLGFLMLACHEAEYEVGDCNLMEHALQLFGDIGRHSKIRVTLEQLDSLVFHYKQAVMNKLDASRSLRLTPDEYQSLLRTLSAYLPNYMKRNKFGEFEIVGFNHKYGKIEHRRKAYKKRLQAAEKEFIEAKV